MKMTKFLMALILMALFAIPLGAQSSANMNLWDDNVKTFMEKGSFVQINIKLSDEIKKSEKVDFNVNCDILKSNISVISKASMTEGGKTESMVLFVLNNSRNVMRIAQKDIKSLKSDSSGNLLLDIVIGTDTLERYDWLEDLFK